MNFDDEIRTGFRPTRTPLHLKKALGQHFLRDREAAARIASFLSKKELVVEIGPGDGALTQELLDSGHRVLAIEIDRDMIPLLKKRFHRQKETFNLIVEDVLRVDWAKLAEEHGTISVAGNLPYNIASQIIFSLLNAVRNSPVPIITDAIVMVQKEVAERLTGKPGNKIYGALTILTDYHCIPEYLMTIPAREFYPKPQVDGGVIRLRFRKPSEFPPIDYMTLRRIVKGCFAQRRKVLSNSLRVVNDLPDGWKGIPLDWQRRPEQLSPQEFYDLTKVLVEKGLPTGMKDGNNLNDLEDAAEI